MGREITDFVHDWVSENVHFNGYPTEDGVDPEAESLAIELIAAAEERGFSKEQLEEEFDDLPRFLHRQLERVADEEVKRQAGKSD